MEEIWKDIKGYEGLYQVSNFGNVKSIDRLVKGKSNTQQFKVGKKLFVRKGKYLQVILWKNNKYESKLIHRLVAETFLDYKNYKYTEYDKNKIYKKEQLVINHKDLNKQNNHVDNLEWCTYSYNNRYGENTNSLNKKVYQYNCNNELIKEYKSISECARINKLPNKTLNNHCHLEDLYKGYIWKLKKEVVCYD